jgi:hypothetical protein
MRTQSVVVGPALFVMLFAGDVMATNADPSLEPLLDRLAAHAARFEQMKTKAAFTLTGHMEELDRHGGIDGTKDVEVSVTPTGAASKTEIIRYIEDGTDKTSDARAKAAERSRHPPPKKSEFHLPFLASEQRRYVFSLVERDAQVPTHVRIAFTPHVAAEDAYKGSAWVDETDGEVLTIGFSLSKNPMFIDHIDATLVFALPTALGRAPSKFTFEATGGFLFVKKRYRGWATISRARLL